MMTLARRQPVASFAYTTLLEKLGQQATSVQISIAVFALCAWCSLLVRLGG